MLDVDGDGLLDRMESLSLNGASYWRFVHSSVKTEDASGGKGTITPFARQTSASAPSWAVNEGSPPENNPHTLVADMNGDGIADLVQIFRTAATLSWDAYYAAGNGSGSFNYCSTPPCSGPEAGLHLQHAGSLPIPANVASHDASFADVNGDGLADLVYINRDPTYAGIYVLFNTDGQNLGTARWIPATHLPSWDVDHLGLTFADMNGNGVDDIVVLSGATVTYIDMVYGQPLAAPPRPGLLKGITNGRGVTTEIAYESTLELGRGNAAAGTPWTFHAPQAAHVVTRITSSNNLPGIAGQQHQSTYNYFDPAYDGWQRRLLGFRKISERRYGDSNNPTSIVDTTYFFDACADNTPDCAPRIDTSYEPAQGAAIVTEVSSDGGAAYLSTTIHKHRVQSLVSGMDGRTIRFAYEAQTDTYLYDTSPFVATGGTTTAQVICPGDQCVSVTVPIRSSAGRKHLRAARYVDASGNTTMVKDYGLINDDGSSIDPPVTHDYFWTVTKHASRWQWRIDHVAQPRPLSYVYNEFGEQTDVYSVLSGTLPLDRFHEDSTKATAPPPPTASADGPKHLGGKQYDSFGNVVVAQSPGSGSLPAGFMPKCQQIEYDQAYSLYAESVTDFSAGCGSGPITTIRLFDHGFGLVNLMTDPTGAASTTNYDAFGRVSEVLLPTPNGVPPTQPSVQIKYTDPQDGPFQRVQLARLNASGGYDSQWSYTDGFGTPLATLSPADVSAGDGAAWIVSGVAQRTRKGLTQATYQTAFYAGDPSTYPIGTTPAVAARVVHYDAFDRVIDALDYDSTLVGRRAYHALSVDAYSANDLVAGRTTPTPTTTTSDGHGRVVATTQLIRLPAGATDSITASFVYQTTGELTTVTRTHTGGPEQFVRSMSYDSLGRMVQNVEPNSSTTGTSGAVKAWRYAYDDAGHRVGTSDARGCGLNQFFDGLGRLLAQDYSPCLRSQQDYTSPNLATGDGTEVSFRYDSPEPGQAGAPLQYAGRPSAISDRASHTRMIYDWRGRTVAQLRQLAIPGTPSPFLVSRYAPTWYASTADYDEMDRPVRQSTGVDAPELLGADGQSNVTYGYSARGVLTTVGGSYGTLVSGMQYDAEGALLRHVYGDLPGTASTNSYDGRHRLRSTFLGRKPPPLWSQQPPPVGYPPPPSGSPSTLQTDLTSALIDYDADDNPIRIQDLRDPVEWPAGAQPVTRAMQYDDFNRLTRVDYAYPAGTDSQVPAFAAETRKGDRSPVPQRALPTRVQWQTFTYDWQGNTTASDDDLHAFYDRSLATIGNDPTHPNQLANASLASIQPHRCPQGGCPKSQNSLATRYDAAGNLTDLLVIRSGACTDPAGNCSQRFVYDWDEVGQVSRARRWDYTGYLFIPFPNLPPATAVADLRYAYGTSGRVLKTATDANGNQLHSAELLSLRLDHARFDSVSGDYERTALTETAYLGGVARVVYAAVDLPSQSSGRRHVLIEPTDHIGSSSVVIDKETGELVERSTYSAFGASDSDYRPERWGNFREAHRFTGKEEDVEVGLTYFGARYYQASLGRWISTDPLAVHALGADINPYAYVGGSPIAKFDPFGLEGDFTYCFGPICSTTTTSGPMASGYRPSQGTAPRAIVSNMAQGDCPLGCGTKPLPPPPPRQPYTPPHINLATGEGLPWKNQVHSWLYSSSPLPAFFASDTNLKYLQYGFGGVAIVAGTIATGGALLELYGGYTGLTAAGYNTLVAGGQVVTDIGLAQQGITIGGVVASMAARAENALVQGVARAEALAARASQVHGALDTTAQAMRTTAVLDTSAGRVVAGGGVDLNPAQRAMLEVGEVAAKAAGVHAEVTSILAARQMGAQLKALGTTRDFCPFCIDYIEQSGGVVTGPRTAIWPAGQ